MHFAFSADQLELRDAVCDLLSAECTPSTVRAAGTSPPGALDRRLWDSLARMGACELLVAAGEGGLGLDWCSLVLVLEAAGRFALPHPLLETAAVAAPLLGRRIVELVADGRAMGSASLRGSLSSCGSDADWLVVGDEESLVLVDRAVVTGEPVGSVDAARRLMRLSGYDPRGAEVVAEGRAALEAALGRGALGAAAQLLGLSQAMLEMTVNYVSQRRQFGVPVGSFQAIKHQLAEALKELSFARPVVYAAAWSLSVGSDDAARAVSAAKAVASETADLVGRVALQCHGAMGYTVEYDLHLFMKRAWALSRAWGDAASHRRLVGAALGL